MDGPRLIDEVDVVDGTCRPVFEDGDGRQFIEDEGERVYGEWIYIDEPVLITATGSAECIMISNSVPAA